MNSKTAAIVLGSALTGILAAMAFPSIFRQDTFRQNWSQSGVPINQVVTMKIGQDNHDLRVLEITMTNISTRPVFLMNRGAHPFENFDVSLRDGQGFEAPLTDSARRTIAERTIGTSESSWQETGMGPGASLSFRFDTTQIADLSKLNGKQFEVTVTYTPRNHYTGKITTKGWLKRPMGKYPTPVNGAWPIHIP